MKISVITLHTVSNYGSILQTYATQILLEKMGHEVEFVNYYRKDNIGSGAVDKALKSSAMQKYKKLWDRNFLTRKLVRIPLRIMLDKKRSPMRKFLKQRIHLTKNTYFSYEDILKDIPKADIYMTGSDQVWNSVWNNGIEKPFFLEYAPVGKARIAFSASIGREELYDDEIENTRKMLKKYAHIGMREQSGVELLKTLGVKSSVVLDPTLMMTGNEWRQIAEPYKTNKPYILVYQLNANAEMDNYAIELAKIQNWQIVRISYGYSGKQTLGTCLVCPKAEKLLGCFDSAALILTDSFHGTAFSLNLNKDFITVMPNKFGTRIDNILTLTNTNNRKLSSYDNFSIINNKIDFDHINEILDKKREESLSFLKEALDG